jgi:hypothetical protein
MPKPRKQMTNYDPMIRARYRAGARSSRFLESLASGNCDSLGRKLKCSPRVFYLMGQKGPREPKRGAGVVGRLLQALAFCTLCDIVVSS